VLFKIGAILCCIGIVFTEHLMLNLYQLQLNLNLACWMSIAKFPILKDTDIDADTFAHNEFPPNNAKVHYTLMECVGLRYSNGIILQMKATG